MTRTARRFFVGAAALAVVGCVFFAVAARVRGGYREFQTIWTAGQPTYDLPFRIAAFPVGIRERGVPERAIVVPLSEWTDPVGIVRWNGPSGRVAVQRRLLRVDTPVREAAPLIDAMNRALSAGTDPDIRRAVFDVGERSDERRLTVTLQDGLREVYVYRVDYDGAVEAREVLTDGDKTAFIIGGVIAMVGVVALWIAFLSGFTGGVVILIEQKRAATRSSPSAGPGEAPGPR